MRARVPGRAEQGDLRQRPRVPGASAAERAKPFDAETHGHLLRQIWAQLQPDEEYVASGPGWKEKPGIASAGASESRSIAETASDTSCPVAVYFRSASSESSGPSRRRKQPRSMRTSLQRASAAETVAIVGAPVLSDSSPK